MKGGQLQPSAISKRIELESWDQSQIKDNLMQILSILAGIFRSQAMIGLFSKEGKNQIKCSKIGRILYNSLKAPQNTFYFQKLHKFIFNSRPIPAFQLNSFGNDIGLKSSWSRNCYINVCFQQKSSMFVQSVLECYICFGLLTQVTNKKRTN